MSWLNSDYLFLTGFAVWGLLLIGGLVGVMRWIYTSWTDGDPHPYEEND